MTAGRPIPHDSALAHATGAARFADDLPEPPFLLHAALVLSPVARGVLEGLDAPPGVTLLTAAEIPGANDISPSGRGNEPLFADGEIRHHGQPIAMVRAAPRDDALRAAAAVTPRITPLPALLDPEEALAREDYLMPPQVIARGDAPPPSRARRSPPRAASAPAARSTSTWNRRSRSRCRGRMARSPSPPRPSIRPRCSTSSAACSAWTSTAFR